MANAESFDAGSMPRGIAAQGEVFDRFAARPRSAGDPFGLDDIVARSSVFAPQALDIATEDWDILYAAVESRLGLLVDEPVATPIKGPGARFPELRVGVLDCVAALAQLRATLARERTRGRGVELALLEAQNALATIRAELAGARAGERQAWHRALHDSLTSLPNRACFQERLEQSISRADRGRESLAVMYVDLDGFKAINDTHGHAIGDELLCIVGRRLTRAMRADDVVGRQGGDEFACLLSVVPPCVERLERLARELFDTVAEPFQVGDLPLTVRPSIGIAVWPSDGLTAEALLRHADMAMYRAKRERCGHAFYDGHESRDDGPAPSARAPT